jgi:hypothetical protein
MVTKLFKVRAKAFPHVELRESGATILQVEVSSIAVSSETIGISSDGEIDFERAGLLGFQSFPNLSMVSSN